MTEEWKPIAGYEGRYEVSDRGRVRSVDVLVPYNHWRSGERLVRLKRGKMLPAQKINSGYLIVHLHKNNVREAKTVHRLVAETFIPGDFSHDVNHKNTVKTDNRKSNLEWLGRSLNHKHAVDMGCRLSAVPVRCPTTGREYPAIRRAAQAIGRSEKYVKTNFQRIGK